MSVDGPTLGPCSSWIDGRNVADCCNPSGDDSIPSVFEDLAVEASMLMYEISGRRFPGLCDRTVRPCRSGCSCWDAWGDQDTCGDRCGCGPTSKVKLAGYPIQEIVEVLIDGVVVDPAGYRLDHRRELVRLDDPGPPVVKNSWPGCQNMALDSTEPGTFSIEYRWGEVPPPSALRAAAALACQLYRSCGGGGGECKLPKGTTKVVRQGVTVERQAVLNWLNPKYPTGIVEIDVFLVAYWHGNRGGRRSMVWSPDTPEYPKAVGQ